MNIHIVLVHNPFFENSASANRWRTLIEGLAKEGASVTLLITGGYKTLQEWKESNRKGWLGAVEFRYFNFLFYHNIWLRRLNNYVFMPILKPLIFNRLKTYARKYPRGIYWTGSDYDSFQLVLELKKQNSRLVTFLEMSEFLDIHHLNKGRSIHKRMGDMRQVLFEKQAYFAYDGLALMTKTLMQHYGEFPKPGPRLLHLPMTVDLDRFDKNLTIPDGFSIPYIVFVGVMNNAKDGVDILIESFSRISGKFPQHHLYLVGPWNYDTPSHLKRVVQLGLEDKVFWKGEYHRDAIPAIIKNASLLVLPRPDSKQAQGGFPTKLGEYLATGNPVCATTVGEIPDYLKDGESVYFAEPGSVDSFADAMHRALSNPEEARKVGENGRKIAETNFNKDIQAKVLYEFLLDLNGERSEPV